MVGRSTPRHVLGLTVRTGEWLDVDDGQGVDLRQVKSVDFLSNAAAGSMPHDGFNDAGQLAFTATFTDGTGGVFVSSLATLPEPASAGVLAAAMLVPLVAARRARRLPAPK